MRRKERVKDFLASFLNLSWNNGDCPDWSTVCVFKLQREAGEAEAHSRQFLPIP